MHLRQLFSAIVGLLSFWAIPAHAQTISGCRTTAIAKAELSNRMKLGAAADCLGRAKAAAGNAEQVRRDRIAMMTVVVAPVTPPTPPVPTPTPAPVPVPASGKSFLGLNLTGQTYYGGENVYSNLLIGTSWVVPAANWGNADPSNFDRAGNVISLPPGGLNKILTPPPSVLTGGAATIRCTWAGTAVIEFGGSTNNAPGNHSYEFRWADKTSSVFLQLRASSAKDPVRNLDCREKGNTGGLFAPHYLNYVKPFGVLRFMDWSLTNNNAQIRWATRTLPTDLNQSANDGTALENIISLTNETSADVWINVPWNADADYVQRMAQLMHDSIPANRHIYVELSNEVWNPSFNAFHQAWKEGLAEGLSDNGFQATLRRYAERTTEVMKVWTPVFADRPGQLVRVAGTQDGNAWVLNQILEFKDTPQWIDAIATAPYFGHSFFDGPRAAENDVGKLLTDLGALADTELRIYVAENHAVAKKYGKRLIAYEAGQHVISPGNIARLEQMNRDPRMYDIYKKYITAWKAQVNDTMVLFNATGSISQYGAWGIREYAGQPISETPKLRAAQDLIAGD